MATITGSCDNSRYTLTCEWTSTQNISSNTSSITAIVYLNGNGYTTTSSHWSCVINGVTVTSGKSASIGGKTELGRRTWTVTHDSGGKCNVPISFSYSNGLTSAGTYTTRSGSGSSTVSLSTIPRVSTFTMNKSSCEFGEEVTITINKANSSFTHDIYYKLGTINTILDGSITGTTYKFTPALYDMSQIPNSTTGTVTIVVYTKSGGNIIGSTSKTLTVRVPTNIVPSVGISVTPNNTMGGVNVANKTTFTVKPVNAKGAYGSTIKSYLISGGWLNSTSATGATTQPLGSGKYTFTVKVTDSRGRTATASQSVNVHGYESPTFSFNPYRCDVGGSPQENGEYIYAKMTYSIANPDNSNQNAKKYRLSKKTANSATWTVVQDWADLPTYSGDIIISFGGGFSVLSSYDVRAEVKDSNNTTSLQYHIGTSNALLNIEKEGVGIGKIHENGALDVGGDLFVQDNMYLYNQEGTMTGLYTKVGGSTNCLVRQASHGGVDLGDTDCNTAICSKAVPIWWNGSNSYNIYTTNNKPTPQDIGAMQIVSGGGHYGMTANGDAGGWVRTTKSGIIPYQNANTSWSGANSAIGTTAWRFSTGYIKEIYCNGLTNDLGDIWVTAKAGANTIYAQSKWLCPANNTTTYLGSSGYRWHSVWSANGSIQTSDERFKIKRGYANIDDCFEMVKNIGLYKYVMLDQNKEDLSRNRLGKLAMESNEDEAKVHMGIMAQDLQNYECGKYILVGGEYKKEDGTQDTLLNVNPLDMTMALMGALQKEIEYREKLEDQVKQLEEMIQQMVFKQDNPQDAS